MIIVARSKEDYGAMVGFDGVRYRIGPDGVLNPQPLPATAERMLKNRMFAVQGQENTNPVIDPYGINSGGKAVKPPSPDEVRRLVEMAESNDRTSGKVIVKNPDLQRVVEHEAAAAEAARERALEAAVADRQGHARNPHLPPSPAEVTQMVAASQRLADREPELVPPPAAAPAVPARELGGYEQVSQDSIAAAEALSALANMAEVAEAIEEDEDEEADPTANKTLQQLRSMARDRKIAGWADMSESKLRKVLNRR